MLQLYISSIWNCRTEKSSSKSQANNSLLTSEINQDCKRQIFPGKNFFLSVCSEIFCSCQLSKDIQFSNFHDEVVRIKAILKENCFPLPLVDSAIKTFLDQRFSKGPPPSHKEKEFLMFCLPFLGRYSLQVKTKLTRLFKQCYPTVKLKVIFNSPKRLASYFSFKDRLPILMCTSVVYSYKCPGCHALYYGKQPVI